MIFIVIFLMLATLIVMSSGVIIMMSGGKLNRKYSNKLMVARVALQALTLVVMFLAFSGK